MIESAWSLLDSGDPAGALKISNRVLEFVERLPAGYTDPWLPEAYQGRATAYRRLGRDPEALVDEAKFVETYAPCEARREVRRRAGAVGFRSTALSFAMVGINVFVSWGWLTLAASPFAIMGMVRSDDAGG